MLNVRAFIGYFWMRKSQFIAILVLGTSKANSENLIESLFCCPSLCQDFISRARESIKLILKSSTVLHFLNIEKKSNVNAIKR